MKMVKSNLIAIAVAGVLVGCAGTEKAPEEAAVNVDVSTLTGSGFLAACDNPVVTEAGPVQEKLFVVGTFMDSNWQHKEHRALAYVGNNTYQLVKEEKPGKFKMQFASSDWSPQYTVDGLAFSVGAENVAKYGGLGKDAKVEIPVAGKYVWSIELNEQAEAVKAMVSLCK